jgi:hypothetical protein
MLLLRLVTFCKFITDETTDNMGLWSLHECELNMSSSTDYLNTLHITDYLVLHALVVIQNLVYARRNRLPRHLFTHCICPFFKKYSSAEEV